MLALPTVASAQDAEAGKKVFTKCAPCHAVGPGAKNKVGRASGLVGRKAGSVGLQLFAGQKNSGITWDDAVRVHYRPKKKVPATDALPGVKDEVSATISPPYPNPSTPTAPAKAAQGRNAADPGPRRFLFGSDPSACARHRRVVHVANARPR
jgi:cytochrome c